MKPKSRFVRPIIANDSNISIDVISSDHKSSAIEIDYMSDNFLKSLESSQPAKICSKRTAAADDFLSSSSKRKELMETKLVEGANTSISTESKGFKLLQKFGYSEGGLGKGSRGIMEPISITLKLGEQDRSGIGLAQEKKKKMDKFLADMKKISCLRDLMIVDFKTRLIYQNEVKRAKQFVAGAEKVIHGYDTREVVGVHKLWPRDILDDALAEEATEHTEDECVCVRNDDVINKQEDEEVFDRLRDCLYYLREKYCYCYFCGCQYDNNDDLTMNCPGLLYDDH